MVVTGKSTVKMFTFSCSLQKLLYLYQVSYNRLEIYVAKASIFTKETWQVSEETQDNLLDNLLVGDNSELHRMKRCRYRRNEE